MNYIRSPYNISAIKPGNKGTTAASVRLKHSKRSVAQGSEVDQSISVHQNTFDKERPVNEERTLNKFTVNMSRNKRNAATTLNHEVVYSGNNMQIQRVQDDESATLDPSDPHLDNYNRKASVNLRA